MSVAYLLKEANYYRKLGKGHLKRMIFKFLLAKTPLSKLVNKSAYNKIYSEVIKNKAGKTLPTILQIENTNFCNAKCIMCPHTIMKRKAKVMKQSEFIKICKNVLDHYPIKLLIITGFGEPFMDIKLIEKIKWLNENYPNLDVDLYTNASLLTPKLSAELLKLKIHKINFSINGTEKTYGKIMGLDYNTAKNNILNFIKLKSNSGKKYPLTNISLMILKTNHLEIEKIINFWKMKADSIMAYGPSNWAGSLKNADITDMNRFKKKRWPCSFLWSTIMVDVEGNVIMCCRDYESKIKFGNLINENIVKIRSNEKFRTLLKNQLNYKFNMPVCDACDNSFDSSLNWWG